MIASPALAPAVLLVDDDRNLAFGLRCGLERDGFRVNVAHSGRAGFWLATHERPDLVVLDLGLPDLSGHEILRAMRNERPSLPVLILSAQHDTATRARGLALGASDFVTKPFDLADLVARIRALLQHPSDTPRVAGRLVRFGDVRVDLEKQRVFRAGRPLRLGQDELRVLLRLARSIGTTVSAPDLYATEWGHVWGDGASTVAAALHRHVERLRAKLEPDPSRPRYLLTVAGAGYRLSHE